MNYARENFDEPAVMINIMIMDRQLQNLNDNYKLVRSIRDDEKLFNEMINYLQNNFVAVSKRA